MVEKSLKYVFIVKNMLFISLAMFTKLSTMFQGRDKTLQYLK